jgi:small subunit ribosomal protein S9
MKKKSEGKKAGKNLVFTTGKRKRAIARARFKPGSGRITVNSTPLEVINNEIVKMKIKEPLLLIGDEWKKFDIKVNVKGGGITGQAEAVRQAIAKGFVQLLGDDVKKRFLDYDRHLLIADPRRTEPHKPPHSSWGARRYKQRSKR